MAGLASTPLSHRCTGLSNCSRTPSTELYVPRSQRDASCGSPQQVQRSLFTGSRVPVASGSPHAPKRDPIGGKASSEQCNRDGHNLKPTLDCLERPNKRIKRSSSNLLAATEDDALGLTVAAADCVVLAGVLESCFSTHELLPGLTIEAAIQLRRARQRSGLDELCFEAEGYVSVGDEDCIQCLSDSAMHEDFVDVGLSVTFCHARVKNPPE